MAKLFRHLSDDDSDANGSWLDAGGLDPVFDGYSPLRQLEHPLSDNPGAASGQGGTSVSVAASGDNRIDGLLIGSRWSNSFITYTDPDSAADYQSGYTVDNNGNGTSAQNEGFSRISANQLYAVHYALNEFQYTQPNGAHGFAIEAFTNLGIDYGTAGAGTGVLRIANTSDNATGLGYYPANSIYGGDAWMGTAIQTPTQGNYQWNNTLHELGHTLGLKHGQDAGGPANTALPSNYDSLEFTVMTYRSYIGAPLTGYTNGAWDYPQTYMMLDVAALQYMYGADFTSNSGNTTYSWSPTTGQSFVDGQLATNPGGNRIFMTIWDGNGVDTYDLSNYGTDLNIDLSPGGYSDFHSGQSAYLGGGPNNGYARGNVFNALQFNGDARSLIENAIGGSGNDSITGNAANNGLTGNGGNDNLYGLDGNDTLNGNAGNDYMKGGGGNDALYGGDNDDTLKGGGDADTLDGGAGIDTVDYGDSSEGVSIILGNGAAAGSGFGGTAQGDVLYNIENITGSGYNDSLTGNSSNNIINGGSGADTMAGGAGSDIYYVDNAGDVVVENANAGTDRVSSYITYTLTANVENLVLLGSGNIDGTGNSLNNIMTGNDGNNVLNGGLGVDTMRGGLGNDSYWINAAGDKVVELANAGTDLVYSSISYTLTANVENLILLGSANISGTGNGLANIITGNDGNNTLNGSAGADTMRGGLGNDIYWVDNIGDKVVDIANAGTDRVNSTISYTLTGNVENLSLAGAANLNGTGNGLANTINGNAGNNLLDGLLGADRLTGGAGLDTFRFSTGPSATNIDRIMDFNVADDRITLEDSVFTALSPGALPGPEFANIAAANTVVGANQHILYNQTTGALYYDSNGGSSAGRVQIAWINNHAALTAADFFVV